MDFLSKLFMKSVGLKRTIASILVVAGQVAATIPAAAPYAETINTLAAFFGAAGVAHAIIAK